MIKMEDVRKQYGDFVFEGFLKIPDGMITGLVGKNGAGKSTAIRLMLGLTKPDRGTVWMMGKNASEISVSDKEKIGVSLSETGFSVQLTVDDVEKILKKMYSRFDQTFFSQCCQQMQLPRRQKIREFSTGMKAKLKILTALSHQAEVLILDEPTAGLDVEARNEVLDLLRTYLTEDEKRSVLITSHISSDLENLCDDIYLIHDGKFILHEETDVILEKYGVIKVSEEQYKTLDKEYLLQTIRKDYGYACFTECKQYYKENYPGIVVENGSIDGLILMMTGGDRV